MYHVGDITKLDGHTLAPVECITGGSPCQDLSIAGKREGLAGERSGLFMEMIRVIREMREEDIKNGRTNEHIRPRFVIWENVAGAFTSNRGQDFRAVLEEFCRIKESDISIPMPDNGKWAHSGAIAGNGFSLAWRLMDAQYFGVPQRRKRIALVVDYGGENAADILFTGKPFVGDITDGRFGKVLPVEEGLRRDFETSREAREGVAGSAEKCADKTGFLQIVYDWHRPDTRMTELGDVCVTMSANWGTGGNNTPYVLEGNGSRESHHGDGYKESEVMYTLNTVEHHAICDKRTTVIRRLMPIEAERLQGYPDNWCDIPGASDNAKLKALGNSMALPQWQIIIDNMAKYLPEKATLGSLFDGIGGFPLCWERTHGKGTAIWASEIEPFPIAVTKYRFGGEE